MERKIWIATGLLLLALVFYMLFPFINVLIYGLFIYYISRPIYRRINKHVSHGFMSAFASLFWVTLPILAVIIYTVLIASTELSGILSDPRVDAVGGIKSLISSASALASDIEPAELLNLIRENKNIGEYFFGVGLTVLSLVFKLILSFIAAFVFLRDEGRFRKWFVKSFLTKDESIAEDFFTDIDNAISHVFTGSILTAGITAIVASLLFTILNIIAPHEAFMIPYPLLLGILCGLANLIPAIGIKLVWVPLFLYITANAIIAHVIMSGVLYLIVFLVLINLLVDSFPEYLIRPYTSGGRVEPGILLFAYIFGPLVFGISGLFIGPIIVICAASFVEKVLPRLRK